MGIKTTAPGFQPYIITSHGCLCPGPATLVAKGYASLAIIVLKNAEKGSFFCVFSMSLISEKRVHFLKNVSGLGKKGSLLRHFHWKRVIFWCSKSVFFSYVNISERGDFLI